MLTPEHRDTANELCRIGDLAWMLDEHQRKFIYEPYRAWEKRFHQDRGKGASRIFMIDAGRQVGKTFTTDLIKVEDCARAAGTKHLLASAEEIALKEFVIPNVEAIIAHMPEDVRPVFIANRNGMKAAYYFPNGSVLKLVGIDKNPDGLRGPKLHGAAISEAGFVRKLKSTVNGIIYPQFQRVLSATLILESSAPSDPDHDFDVTFKPSCEKRGAYVFMTIDDNTALDEETKREFVEAAREIDPVDAEREYYGKRVRPVKSTVFTSFDKARHQVRELPVLEYGLAMTAIDPGQVHQYGLLFSVFDYANAVVHYVDCWAEHNPSTERVAAIMAARELELWGAHPPAKLSRIPLDDEYDAQGKVKALGWRTLLAGDRTEHLAERLHDMCSLEVGVSDFKWYDNDAKQWMSNPHVRVSDIELQVINDLTNVYGMVVEPTTKESLRSMAGFANAKLSQGAAIFGPQATLAAQHVNACQWQPNRKKFAEHNLYAHYDLASCFVYSERYWDHLKHIYPVPPQHLDAQAGPDFVGMPEWDDDDDSPFF